MPNLTRMSLLTVALTTGVVLATPIPVAQAKDFVAQSDMPKYCQGRVAEKYHVSPRDILTLPLEQDANGFVVYGQFPPEGSAVTTFECHFGPNGKWKRVKATSSVQPPQPAGDVVAEADMGKYCVGEASAAFGERPQDMLTLPTEKDPGGYVVYGQYPATGTNVTTFECHYSGSGVFQTVFKN